MGVSENDRCDTCGGRLDKPGLFGCERKPHPAPGLAMRIVAAIERDIRGRGGMDWGDVGEETQYEIRDVWAHLVCEEIELACLNMRRTL